VAEIAVFYVAVFAVFYFTANNSAELESSVRKPGTQRTKIFYAHPFSAWERGTNENACGIAALFCDNHLKPVHDGL
jgi:IS30 family transposase